MYIPPSFFQKLLEDMLLKNNKHTKTGESYGTGPQTQDRVSELSRLHDGMAARSTPPVDHSCAPGTEGSHLKLWKDQRP